MGPQPASHWAPVDPESVHQPLCAYESQLSPSLSTQPTGVSVQPFGAGTTGASGGEEGVSVACGKDVVGTVVSGVPPFTGGVTGAARVLTLGAWVWPPFGAGRAGASVGFESVGVAGDGACGKGVMGTVIGRAGASGGVIGAGGARGDGETGGGTGGKLGAGASVVVRAGPAVGSVMSAFWL